ncbi:MAG: hypothetical protein PVI90_13720 [Desulfobacteraceae bacterium]|jgi:hypothetical protein
MSYSYCGNIKKLFGLLVILIFLVNGCGESSSGSSDDFNLTPNGPTLSNFVGTYNLNGFTLTQIDTGNQADESDAENWCGTTVITSEGIIYTDLYINDGTDNYAWEILEINDDTLLLSNSGCEESVDYTLSGGNLTLMWPESQCFAEDYAIDFELSKDSDSETYPVESCMSSDSPNDSDGLVPELVGTYEMLSYEMTDSEDDYSIDGIQPDDTWSGQMTISSSNTIIIDLTIDETSYRSECEITGVDDIDSDGTDDALTIIDEYECESYVVFINYSEENMLALGFPASTCTDGIEMTYVFEKISDTIASTNSDEKDVVINLYNNFPQITIKDSQEKSKVFKALTDGYYQ